MNSNLSKASSYLVKKICSRKIENLGIEFAQKNGFIGNLLNIKNEVITFSFNGKKETFKSKDIYSVIDKALKGSRKTEWLKEETMKILSSEVNKTIDAACKELGYIINNKQKNDIFCKISSGIGKIKLDPKCTQSSISQILYNNKSVSERIERLSAFSQSRDEKNELTNTLNSVLTNRVFMKKFGGIDLNQLRENTAEAMVFLVKSAHNN